MKVVLFSLLCLLLSACNSMVFMDDESQDKKTPEAPVQTVSDEDLAANKLNISYLQIAKDLYVTKQYKQAFQIASKLSEDKNNVEAQYLLGYMLYYGHGVTADIEQGKKWISIAADTGYRPAIEALVLIKHGLTPDNKCSSVDLMPKTETEHAIANKNESSVTLQEGEVLITPEGSRALKPGEIKYIESDKLWKRYTIQLIISRSKSYAQKYAAAFKLKYPDLQEHIIVYQSKNFDRDYGVGFSTFEHEKDARIVLQNIKERLNNSSLWIRSLEKFEPVD